MTNLTYYIFEGLLVVSDSYGSHKTIFAISGGGNNLTQHSEYLQDPNAMNNPYSQGQKEISQKDGKNEVFTQRGRAIPVGFYKVSKPFFKGTKPNSRWAELRPQKEVEAGGRKGFYIHHQGPKGSDGCIVPRRQEDFDYLMNNLEKNNGGNLAVFETTESEGLSSFV